MNKNVHNFYLEDQCLAAIILRTNLCKMQSPFLSLICSVLSPIYLKLQFMYVFLKIYVYICLVCRFWSYIYQSIFRLFDCICYCLRYKVCLTFYQRKTEILEYGNICSKLFIPVPIPGKSQNNEHFRARCL